jgi:hypothetical protein
MTKYDVVLVQFPFDDLSSAKVRPAVCLTEPIGPHQHLILAFVTSRIPAVPLKTDLVIHASGADFASTGLQVSRRPVLKPQTPRATEMCFVVRDQGETVTQRTRSDGQVEVNQPVPLAFQLSLQPAEHLGLSRSFRPRHWHGGPGSVPPGPRARRLKQRFR